MAYRNTCRNISRNISQIKNLAWVLVVIALLSACSNQPTYVIDHNEKIDFSTFKTYRWYDDVHSSQAAEYRQYNSSDKRVRHYVDRELEKKGFKETHSGTPDFLFNYHISKKEQMKIENFSGYPQGMHGGVGVGNYGSAVGIGYSSGPSVKVYKEGTVVFDIFDTRSDKLVWRGIAEGRMKNSLSHNDRDRIASVLTGELLADFPPAPAPQH